MDAVRSYIICTAPRSGSTMLCSMLSATGVAGQPDSFFHGATLAAWAEGLQLKLGASLSERVAMETVVAEAMRLGRGASGVFGLRLQAHSMAPFFRKLGVMRPEVAGDLGRFRAVFGPCRFVYLKREDKVAQAVSYVKAEQSGLWHVAPDGREVERLAAPAVPRYDANRIAACVEEMVGYDRQWEDWFAAERVAPLRLSYDALAARPDAVLAQVLTALGQDASKARGVSPGVAKLADRESESWIARFRAERGPV